MECDVQKDNTNIEQKRREDEWKQKTKIDDHRRATNII